MKLSHTPRRRRGAFTLIELLVVIAIIAILVALIAGAAFKAMIRGYEAQARNDVSGLATAVNTFQTEFKVHYIPSRIRLYEDMSYPNVGANTPVGQYERDSLQYLQMLWPRLSGPVDWNGDGQNAGGAAIDLEGDQCLVFFLGGIPTPPGVSPGTLGFSADPFNPSSGVVTGASRKGPYFTFQANRLYDRGAYVNGTQTAAGFFSYKDPYGRLDGTVTNTIAYFSSYKNANGYFRYVNTPIAGNLGSDCSTLLVSPYVQTFPSVGPPAVALQCQNANSFQIISAGRDGVFGRGSLPAWSNGDPLTSTWTPKTAGTTTATWAFSPNLPTPAVWNRLAGGDDLSNFHGQTLGSPAQ
jgi:prepilin-type N-terminal cleavage/methylation domain-containing protein